MNFFQFLIFDFISFVFKILILLFIYKFFVRKKCNIFSKIAEHEISSYFNAYDDNFVDSINILEDDVNEEKL